MKTIKLYFALILVILVTNSFSQQNPARGKHSPDCENKTVIKSDQYESGICSFHASNPEVIYEPELRMDYWMIIPFMNQDPF